MGYSKVCDGCGLVSDAVVVRGLIRPRDYCGECAKIVDDYILARDKLHTQIATDWNNGLEAIKTHYEQNFPRMSLPDG